MFLVTFSSATQTSESGFRFCSLVWSASSTQSFLLLPSWLSLSKDFIHDVSRVNDTSDVVMILRSVDVEPVVSQRQDKSNQLQRQLTLMMLSLIACHRRNAFRPETAIPFVSYAYSRCDCITFINDQKDWYLRDLSYTWHKNVKEASGELSNLPGNQQPKGHLNSLKKMVIGMWFRRKTFPSIIVVSNDTHDSQNTCLEVLLRLLRVNRRWKVDLRGFTKVIQLTVRRQSTEEQQSHAILF